MTRISTALLCIAALPLTAMAGDFSAGLGVVTSQKIFRDDARSTTPIPFINYRSNTFFIQGITAGYNFYKQDGLTAAAIIKGDMNAFDPDKATTSALKKLDERKAGALAGVQVSYILRPGDIISASLLGDVSGRHKAWIPELGWQHFFGFSDRTTQYFSNVDLKFNPAKYSNYYYGVSQAESLRSGLAAYAPGGKVELSASLGVNHAITPKVSLTAIAGVRNIGSGLGDSPLVQRSTALSGVLGVSYKFD